MQVDIVWGYIDKHEEAHGACTAAKGHGGFKNEVSKGREREKRNDGRGRNWS